MGAGQGERLHRHLGHRPALDGLRGVAVLLIVVYHSNALLAGSGSASAWPGGGFLGVDIFFVLSGFLITSLLLQELERSGRLYMWRFFGRRALRLLPALYFLLLVHVLYVWITDLPLRPEARNVLGAALYFKNWIGVFHPNAADFFPPHGAAGLGHLWSLSLEMQFYVIWPFVVLYALSLRRKTSTCVSVLVVLLASIVVYRWLLWNGGTLLSSLYSRTDTRADALIVGTLVAVLWLRVDLPRRFARWFGLIGATVVIFFIMRFRTVDPFLWKGGLTIFAAAVGLLLFSVLSSNWGLTRVLQWRPLVATGVVSYGVYLWHAPVFDVVDRYGEDWSAPARVVTAALLTVFFTGLSWWLVERPFLRRKLHLEAPGIESTGPILDEVGGTTGPVPAAAR